MKRILDRPIQLGAGGCVPSEQAIRCLSTTRGVQSGGNSPSLTLSTRWPGESLRWICLRSVAQCGICHGERGPFRTLVDTRI